MLNHIVNTDTEKLILNAARDIFQKKGLSGARMDDIAKAAGVNKALVHYYFRSKQKLFDRVFREAIGQFLEKIIGQLEGDLPLDVKIYKVVDMYSNMLIHNKHLPLFVLSELRENPDLLLQLVKSKKGQVIQKLQNQLQLEHEKGNIKNMSVQEFFLNLISLIIFPFVARPLIKGIFDMDEDAYDQMIYDRKKRVPRMIIDMMRIR